MAQLHPTLQEYPRGGPPWHKVRHGHEEPQERKVHVSVGVRRRRRVRVVVQVAHVRPGGRPVAVAVAPLLALVKTASQAWVPVGGAKWLQPPLFGVVLYAV